MRIAALDDNIDELDLVRKTMLSIGHECHVYSKGEALLRALGRESFDLILLDWELPDISGPEIVEWIRTNIADPIPVLMLTNRSEEVDVVHALSIGADDFMTKPIRAKELTARVQAILRRIYPPQEKAEYSWGQYRFITSSQQLEINGQPVALKTKEYELALFLFRNLGRLLSRQYLKEQLWGIKAAELNSRSLDTHVSSVRNKLGLNPQNGFRLTSVYGFGYRLEIAE